MGGKAPIFLTNTLVKLVASTKLERDKLYQIKGFLVKVILCKSRSSEAGLTTTLVYDQRNGFDNELSMLEFLKSEGKLKGGGLGYFIEGMETVKFRLSNFKQKLADNPEFKDYFYSYTRNLLEATISPANRLHAEKIDLTMSSDAIAQKAENPPVILNENQNPQS